MKKLLALGLIALFAIACANNGENSNSDANTGQTDAGQTSAYDEERGEGEFTNVEVGPGLDEGMALHGESVYNVKCGSCHKLSDERLVGPGFKGVTERRTATWMMNFLTNTDEMIDLDPELQAQLEICLVRMPDQNLTENDARSIYEYMRKNDGVNL